jgi:DNA-3-methyladenine glycosylase II
MTGFGAQTAPVTSDALPTSTFTIEPQGPFSLEEAARFGFGQRAGDGDAVMRLAFCVDGYQAQAAAVVRQDDLGVHVDLQAGAGVDVDVARRQVARVLSLDLDGNEFTAVGRRDPVIGRLQAVAPGLRPPLFYSPYEAAAWAVLSARRRAAQAAAVRESLNAAHGMTFHVAGRPVAAFPVPERLLEVTAFPGIDATRLARLHGVAAAALDGRLDVARLLAMGPEAAMAEMRGLDGIGPFYSALIVVRGTGFADVLPSDEPRLMALVASLYGLPGPPGPGELATIAERWRPLRTWAAVLIRAAGPRLPVSPLTSSRR